jgi:hypothetical protein
MTQELRKVFQDIRLGRNIETYVLVIAAIVVAVLDIFDIASPSVINAAVLGALAVLLYGRVLDQRQFSDVAAKSGIREFHPSRSSVPPLHSTLSATQHELLLIGISLSTVIQSQLSILEDLARRGRKVKLAIWEPSSEDPHRTVLVKALEDLIDAPNFGKRTVPGRLRHWYSGLDTRARQNIEIRTYSTFPTVSIIFIDKDHPQGYVHVEPIIYRARPEELPSFRLGVLESPTLLQVLRKRYSQLWDESKPLLEG